MSIPFVDLKKQYQNIKTDIDQAIQEVVENTAFIKGKYVSEFESSFARLMDVKHCIGVANGTDALYITMKALGIGPGDEVITVANSWISTSETISQTGATPVFIDIHPEFYTIDTDLIESKISSKTKAIIPVHLFGQSVDMDIITNLCKEHSLYLIEDCAQSHLAEHAGNKVGSFGIAGTFSFFPGKNLGAYGDAGGIITNDDEFATKARMFANHGALKKHQHEIEGINSRLDGLQASILLAKLPYLDQWSSQRLDHALYYNELLEDIDEVIVPKIKENGRHVFHLYVVRVKQRDQLQTFLKEKGISTGIHYPTPLPLLNAYKYLNYQESDIPVAAKYQHEILSLPMFPELTNDQILAISNAIKSFY
ncbi:erythromycin biosynthesis sensory transduction protein eryC1 [Candidatus Marinamargulisbacteria bacterium SCGC AG-333-B06]|nr:erythromycin biosynthesis sensory transduction protein eryC1 [Candidatus Marinamargulisbacteria bacterium SCGC AG-333-B06]